MTIDAIIKQLVRDYQEIAEPKLIPSKEFLHMRLEDWIETEDYQKAHQEFYEQKDAYDSATRKFHNDFKKHMLQYLGIANDPRADYLWGLALKYHLGYDSHSDDNFYHFYEIASAAEDFTELLK